MQGTTGARAWQADSRAGASTGIPEKPWLFLGRSAHWIALTLVLVGGTQTAVPAGQQQVPNIMNHRPRGPFDDLGGMDTAMAERQLRTLNAERQKSIVTDTAKLLKLASGLKAEIGASNSDELSAAEMREVIEIEKLARNVRQKMSLTIGDGPVFRDPFSLPVR